MHIRRTKRYLIGPMAFILSLLVFFLALFPSESFSLTVDEAIKLAREVVPSSKALKARISASENLYEASKAMLYYPELDLTLSARKFYAASGDYDTRGLDTTLSYVIYDGGKTRSESNISKLTLNQEHMESERNNLDIDFGVKTAFFRVLALFEALSQKKTSLDNAGRIHEAAEGRRRLGVSKLSDALQAGVRESEARYQMLETEGEYMKALSELSSLIGKPLDVRYSIEGRLDTAVEEHELTDLITVAIERPEIKKIKLSQEIARNNIALKKSEYFPRLVASASYLRNEGGVRDASESESIAGIALTWNIFSASRKFTKLASEDEMSAQTYEMDELMRVISLDIAKRYRDVKTMMSKLTLSEQQLSLSEKNYEQAFGEYKVGKLDMVSLLTAETSLSASRLEHINAGLGLRLAVAGLERSLGIYKLEDIQ